MLLAMGAAARWLGDFVRLTWVRRTTGVLILLFGVYTLTTLEGHVHAGHGSSHAATGPIASSSIHAHEY